MHSGEGESDRPALAGCEATVEEGTGTSTTAARPATVDDCHCEGIAAGTTFTATDGCNVCTCNGAGQADCTTVECNRCVIKGVDHSANPPGDSWKCGCNICSCEVLSDGEPGIIGTSQSLLPIQAIRSSVEIKPSFFPPYAAVSIWS